MRARRVGTVLLCGAVLGTAACTSAPAARPRASVTTTAPTSTATIPSPSTSATREKPPTPTDCSTLPPAVANSSDGVTSLPSPGPVQQLSAGSDADILLQLNQLQWWAGQRLRVIEAGPYLIVGDTPDEVLRRTAVDLRHGVTVVSRLLGVPMPRDPRALILLPSSLATYAKLAGPAWEGSEGVTRMEHHNPFIVISPVARVDEIDVVWPRMVLAHELVHLVMAPSADPQAPMWLLEGHAEMASELTDPPSVLDNDEVVGQTNLALPTAQDFQRQPDQAYARAASFVRYLCSLRGPWVLATFATAVQGTPAQLDAEARRTFGKPLAALVAGWRGYAASRPAD